MLVLTRRSREALTLIVPGGREIVIRMLDSGPVRMGIDALADVAVYGPEDAQDYVLFTGGRYSGDPPPH